MGILWSLLIGLIAGLIAGKIMRGGSMGWIVNIIVGMLGGAIGGWVFTLLGFDVEGGIIPQLLVAVVGACILLWIVNLISGKKKA
ncbi:transglycosylase [Porphyromonas macacae]|nr:GlsB/YeaQ/YmgE family stress response membrane protein [Porphyromonas macacae]KGO00603.1 transglycosylase [Porphyromonas macacae]